MTSPSPPSPAPPTVDFGRSFRFVVDDPDWVKKVLIGAAFTLASSFIIGAFFVAGYWVRLVKNVAAGQPRPLPEWDDLGGIFGDGLKIVGVYVVHVLAIMIVLGGLGCIGGLVVFGVGGLGRSSEQLSHALGALGGLGFAGLYLLFVLFTFTVLLGTVFPLVVVTIALASALTRSTGIGTLVTQGFLIVAALTWEGVGNPWGVSDPSLLLPLVVGLCLVISPRHWRDARRRLSSPARP